MDAKNITFLSAPSSLRSTVILNAISERRKLRKSSSLAMSFGAGDILAARFWKRSYIHRFEGICLSKKKRSLVSPEVSFTLRNVLFGIGIESTISYYYNRVYKLTTLDYKRKKFVYSRSKLYYLRTKLNRATRVK